MIPLGQIQIENKVFFVKYTYILPNFSNNKCKQYLKNNLLLFYGIFSMFHFASFSLRNRVL